MSYYDNKLGITRQRYVNVIKLTQTTVGTHRYNPTIQPVKSVCHAEMLSLRALFASFLKPNEKGSMEKNAENTGLLLELSPSLDETFNEIKALNFQWSVLVCQIYSL